MRKSKTKKEVPDKALERDIAELISHSDHPEDPGHSKNTRKWLLKLDPTVGYHVQVAALAHDIERAVYSLSWGQKEPYNLYKSKHERRSAKVINDLLKKHGYPWIFRRKVKKIVKNHEFGDGYETNLVKDADSISFFDHNLNLMMKRHPDAYVIRKCRWMYDRAGDKARGFIRKLDYSLKAKRLLKNVF